MVCPKIKFYDKPHIIEYAGCTPIGKFTVKNSLVGYGESDTGQHETIVETPFGHKVALMVSTEVIKKIGLLPEIYFLYYDEMDWAERIKESGFKIFYYPKSEVFHKKIDSQGVPAKMLEYYQNRSRILFTRRNFKGSKKLLALLYLYNVEMPKLFFKYFFTGKFANVAAVCRSVWWNILTFDIHVRCNL
jgi:GT2 family glycosyltransferase